MKIKENTIQITIVTWCKQNNILVYHAMNNAKNAIQGAVFKKMGVLAGIPDLFIPQFKLYLELKSINGRLSKKQIEIIEKLRLYGYRIETPRSAKEAIDIIKEEQCKY